jgi:hypothetical protein
VRDFSAQATGRGAPASDNQRWDYVSAYVSQPEIPALDLIGQLGVIEAQQMQQGRMQIMDVDLIFHHIEAKFVGLADARTRLDATARHPHRERLRVMVAAVGAALHHRRPAELAAP